MTKNTLRKGKLNQAKSNQTRSNQTRLNEEDYLYGIHSLGAILDRSPEKVLVIYTQKRSNKSPTPKQPTSKSMPTQRIMQLLDQAKSAGISCQEITPEKIQEKVGNVNHQGIVAQYRPSKMLFENDLIDFIADKDQIRLLILDGVTDPHNLGACIRTAEGMGMQGIIAPKDNSAPLNNTVRKVASGATETLPFYQVTNLARIMTTLKDAGVWVIGAACDETAKPLQEISFDKKLAIVMGSEGYGMRSLTAKTCDELAYIPMQGYISSLNVSVATGVFLYEALRQKITSVPCNK